MVFDQVFSLKMKTLRLWIPSCKRIHNNIHLTVVPSCIPRRVFGVEKLSDCYIKILDYKPTVNFDFENSIGNGGQGHFSRTGFDRAQMFLSANVIYCMYNSIRVVFIELSKSLLIDSDDFLVVFNRCVCNIIIQTDFGALYILYIRIVCTAYIIYNMYIYIII